jgi:hypothetical protein
VRYRSRGRANLCRRISRGIRLPSLVGINDSKKDVERTLESPEDVGELGSAVNVRTLTTDIGFVRMAAVKI